MTTADGAPEEDAATDDPSKDAAPADVDDDDSTDDAPSAAPGKAPSHRRRRRGLRQRIADALGPNEVEDAPEADGIVAELDGTDAELDGEPEKPSASHVEVAEEPDAEKSDAKEQDVGEPNAEELDGGDELRAGEGEDSVGDYGVDSPGAVRAFAWAAAATFGLTLIAAVANSLVVMSVLFFITVALTFELLTLIWSSRVAKLRERVKIIDALGLEGDERVLDVGCGRGLLLVEAASRLDAGEAIGIDVWRGDDEVESSPDLALANAEIEGVDDRVLVETADARALPFEDGAFDAVVSGMVSRNIPDDEGRADALGEIDRVLAPGGRLVIIDVAHTDDYVAALRRRKWTEIRRSRLVFRMFPPIRYVTGTKPGGEPMAVPEEPALEEPTAEPDADEIAADADAR